MRHLAPAFVLIAACGSNEVTTPNDMGVPPQMDAGDRRVEPDAHTSVDSGIPADVGAVDSGPVDAGAADLGVSTDSGVPMDSGSPADTGVSPDSGAIPNIPDPEQTGPLPTSNFTETHPVSATGNSVPLDCYVPTSGGPYPLVLIGHGFQLPASQYTGYATHLAGFGYVACTSDFQAGFIANHVDNATDFAASIDHLLGLSSQSGHPLSQKIDANLVGVTGHSLGGKVSFIAANADPRIGAVFGIDPVDSSMFCDSTRCPDASDMLPFFIPVGVIGETLDASGRPACAPQADNFQTFYSAASAPAIQIDVLGAGHMSFIDDPASCGLPCLACQTASAAHADVIRITRAMMVAFFERHLKGDVSYDEYLTGPTAQNRYETSGLATITAK